MGVMWVASMADQTASLQVALTAGVSVDLKVVLKVEWLGDELVNQKAATKVDCSDATAYCLADEKVYLRVEWWERMMDV